MISREKMKVKRVFNLLLREFPLYYISRLFNILPNHGVTCLVRGAFVRFCFNKCGRKFSIAQGGIINYPENIIIGNNVYIAHRCYINARGGVELGNNIKIGPNVVIATTNHKLEFGKVINDGAEGKVYVGSGTWIGGNVTIVKGVSIGNNCIIAAGAVVTHDIQSNSIAAGVPARVIKRIED